jgi:hypothetical protein
MWTKNVLSNLIELQLAHCVGSMDLLDLYFAIRMVAALQGADTQALKLHIYHHFSDLTNNLNYLTELQVVNTMLYDIPHHEEALPKMMMAPRHLRINDFSDTAARNLTRFNVQELCTLFYHFGFGQYAAQFDDTPDMMIPIETGYCCNRRRIQPCFHGTPIVSNPTYQGYVHVSVY